LAPLDSDRFVGRIAPRPVLILNGIHDPTVPRSSATAFQSAARAPKVIVNYEGGHIPQQGAAAVGNAERIASFLLRYVVEPGGQR
jgi:fermentation-respiration switch protein FrsA (DUF1100 family)